MIKIGEFSKLVQVQVATLRYYDQVGLLKPVEVIQAVCRAVGLSYNDELVPRAGHRMPFATLPWDRKWFPLQVDEWRDRSDLAHLQAAIAKWEQQYGRFDFALTRTETGFDGFYSKSSEWILSSLLSYGRATPAVQAMYGLSLRHAVPIEQLSRG